MSQVKRAPIRVDPTVARVQKLQEDREKRRQAQEEIKRNRAQELKEFNDKGRVGDVDYQRMINDFRAKHGDTSRQQQPPGSTKITVCVRKRPINTKEVTNNDYDSVSVYNPEVCVHECKLRVDGITKYLENTSFYFDHSFSENVDTNSVYIYSAKPLVDFVLDKGGKATCFAYGQTGSGKTYTMSQIQQQAGLEIFKSLRTPKFSGFTVKVSFFEIYGSRVLDLLKKRERLRILEDGKHRVQVVGLAEMTCSSPDELTKYILLANQLRTTSATEVHDQSSRSHAICSISLLDPEEKEFGKLSLIDLAGSERASETSHHDRQKRLEGAEINKSLLALKECIRALDNNQSHIPFRASKLTQVLRDSFQGLARTCMICTISPTSSSSDHTLNTLRYADRIKEKDGSQSPDMPLESKDPMIGIKGLLNNKIDQAKYNQVRNFPSPVVNNKFGYDKKAIIVEDMDDDEKEELHDIDILHRSIRRDRMPGKNPDIDLSEELHKTVTLLAAEEDKLLRTHMRIVKDTANILTEEGNLIKYYQQSDSPDLDNYVDRLQKILEQKKNFDNILEKQLEKCQKLMKREEELSVRHKK